MKASVWKTIDVVAYSLLLIGALNWGLVGLFGFDLVAGRRERDDSDDRRENLSSYGFPALRAAVADHRHEHRVRCIPRG